MSSNELPESLFLSHLFQSRPAIAALNGMLSSVPVIKMFASNSVPLAMSILRSRGIQMFDQSTIDGNRIDEDARKSSGKSGDEDKVTLKIKSNNTEKAVVIDINGLNKHDITVDVD